MIYIHYHYIRSEAESIFQTLNALDDNIKFTIEHPISENSLSLLDFKVTINHNRPWNLTSTKKTARKPIFIYNDSRDPLPRK